MSNSERGPFEGLRSPWLIAAWPGMGKVALSAAGYLIETLPAQPVGEFDEFDPAHFDLERVKVQEGVVLPGRLPRNRLYVWRNPDANGHDLVVFVGEAQPTTGSFRLCHDLLRFARRHGIERIFTFASMVTSTDPNSPSQVFTVATEPRLLEEVRHVRGSLTTLREGEIVGLNGTLLGAAAAADVEAIGFLGEVPQIAVNLPYLKAAHAVLELFAGLAGIELDFTDLEAKAASVERGLQELLRQIRTLTTKQDEGEGSDYPLWRPGGAEGGAASEDGQASSGAGGQLELSPEVLSLIEALFLSAEQDRSRALELKQLLDKHGAFRQYEDRFLDLFKRPSDGDGN